MNIKLSYIFIIFVVLLAFSCSKKDAKDDIIVEPEVKKFIINDLKVKELYPEDDKKFLENIDISARKTLENSLYYREDKFLDKFVYVRNSPYELFDNFTKNKDKLSLDDKVRYLKLSFELKNNKDIDSILKSLNYKRLKEVSFILYSFDDKERLLKYLYSYLDYLLKNNSKEEDNFKDYFFTVNKIDFVEKENFLDGELAKYFDAYLKKYPNSEKALKIYSFYLKSSKKNNEEIKLLEESLKNDKLKSYALERLVNLYVENKNYSKLDKLYKENVKFPENRYLFESYIRTLKERKIWASSYNKIVNDYREEKNIFNFYRYYFSLAYMNKSITTLVEDFYAHSLNSKNKKENLEYSRFLLNHYRNDLGYNLVNKFLIENKNDKLTEDFLVLAMKLLSKKTYKNEEYYFYSKNLLNNPDVIGGMLSLVQNQYKDSSFSNSLKKQQENLDRLEDMNYLYNNFKGIFKNNDKKFEFVKAYFDYYKRISNYKEIKFLATTLISMSKNTLQDDIFKLNIYKFLINISNNRDFEREKIKQLYEDILVKVKDDDKKEYLTQMLYFVKREYKDKEVLTIFNSYLKKYPNSELIYSQLIDIYDYRNLKTKEYNLYKNAIKKFNTNSWKDKLTRFLIRRKMYNELYSFNKELLSSENLDSYIERIAKVNNLRFYKNSREVYINIYKEALEKYPFNETFLNKLLEGYERFRDYKNNYEYNNLLYRYVFIFDLSSRVDNNLMEIYLNQVKNKNKKTIPELIYYANINKFKNNYEEAVKFYDILSRYYMTNVNITNTSAELFKSLASSFYIENPNYLERAESYYKRLIFLERKNPAHYIALAELYYSLNKPKSARNILLSSLDYKKNDSDFYKEIANVFYDYYDYDSAIKVFKILRKRLNKDNIVNAFVGRLYELKEDYSSALNEYIVDLLDKENNSYDSIKRLSSILNLEKVQKMFLSKLSSKYSEIISNYKVFLKLEEVFASISKDKKENLYSKAMDISKNNEIISHIYHYYKESNYPRAEKCLLTLENIEKSNEVYRTMINFYNKNNKLTELNSSYEKLIEINPIENDRISFIELKKEYSDVLITYKKYDNAINELKSLNSFFKDYEKVDNDINIAGIYKLKGKKDYLSYLLKLDEKYQNEERVSGLIFEYYKEEKENQKMLTYLEDLIKRIKKSRSSYSEKNYKIANYRQLMIEELKSLKLHSRVLDQEIEIINRNPLDQIKLKEVYYYSKINNLTTKLFNYYSKLSEKSSKNYKYMLVNARLMKFDRKDDEAFKYYDKALEIEPQSTEILLELADFNEKLKNYKKSYNLYKRVYSILKYDFYLNNMFTLAVKMNDSELISSLAQLLAGNPSDLEDKKGIANIYFVTKILFENNQLELAKKYAGKAYMKVFSVRYSSYFDNILYLVYRIAIKEGIVKEFLVQFFNNYRENPKKRYLMSRFIANHIAESRQFYSKEDFYNIVSYINSNTDDSYMRNAVKELLKDVYLFEDYFSKLKYSYQKLDFYKSRYNYTAHANYIKNAFLYNYTVSMKHYGTLQNYILYQSAWEGNEIALNNLKNLFSYKCLSRDNGVYLEYLSKNNKELYASMVNSYCYNIVLKSYISSKNKELAFKLIDNQDKNEIFKIKEKIKVLNELKLYNESGIKLYQRLLKDEDSIASNIQAKDYSKQLSMKEYNIYFKDYANYLLKMNKDANDILINIAEVSPNNSTSYIEIASVFKDNKKYDKAIEYYNYSLKLKDSLNAKLGILESYYLKKDKVNYNKLKNKLLKKADINVVYNMYKSLKNVDALNNKFIKIYENVIVSNSKKYAYHNLSMFINNVLDYYIEKKYIKLALSFKNRFSSKDYRISILRNLTYNKKLSNNIKISVFKEYTKIINDSYHKFLFVNYLMIIGENVKALKYLQLNAKTLKNEDSMEYYLNYLKLNYYLDNSFVITKVIEEIKESYYFSSLMEKTYNFLKDKKDNKFKKLFYKKSYPLVKSSYFVNSDILKYLDSSYLNKLFSELVYSSDTNNSTLIAYQKGAVKKSMNNWYHQLKIKEYENLLKTKKESYFNGISRYILALLYLEKTNELKEFLSQHKLSVKELEQLSKEIEIMDEKEISLINLNNLNENNEDLLYIKILLFLYSNTSNKDRLVSMLNSLTNFKFDKFKFRLKAIVQDKFSDYNPELLISLKKSLMMNPLDIKLKNILLRTYIKLNRNKQAFYLLAQDGFAYKAFGKLLDSDFNRYNFNASRYLRYSSEYNELIGMISSNENINKSSLDNFINKYDKRSKKLLIQLFEKEASGDLKGNKEFIAALSYLKTLVK